MPSMPASVPVSILNSLFMLGYLFSPALEDKLVPLVEDHWSIHILNILKPFPELGILHYFHAFLISLFLIFSSFFPTNTLKSSWLLKKKKNFFQVHLPSNTSSPFFLSIVATAAAKLLQLCPTLCDPIDGSPPGFAVPGILQARTLERVAISFSNAWKWKVKMKSLSRVRLLATLWTAAYQAPPSMGFTRQEYWSGVPLPSPLSIVEWLND